MLGSTLPQGLGDYGLFIPRHKRAGPFQSWNTGIRNLENPYERGEDDIRHRPLRCATGDDRTCSHVAEEEY
jgi:hypothetical protein